MKAALNVSDAMTAPIDPRHLALLSELASRGSITAVATATHRTPSAVSQQLRTATRDMGVALVERHGRGVQLTEAGRLMADAAVDVDIALERAQARIDALLHKPQGVVRISALPSAAEYLLAPTFAELAEENIDITLLDEDVAERSFADLSQDSDIVIGHSLTGATPIGAEGLNCRVICMEPLDIAMPDTHRLTAMPTIRAEEVSGETWIGVPEGYPFDTILQTIERMTGMPATVSQRVRDNRVVESLVVAGLGIALLPRFTTRARDGLALRPLVGIAAQRWVVAMTRPAIAERAVVKRVLDALQIVGASMED